MSILDESKKLIRTSDGLREYMDKNNGYPSPFIFEAANGQKKVIFYGSNHVHDPNDPMFDNIEKKLNELKPQVVLIEGRRNLVTMDKEELGAKMAGISDKQAKIEGESTFTLKKALELGLIVDSPEPEWSEEVSYVENKGFSRDDIFAYHMLRMIRQYNASHISKTFFQYIENHLKRFREASNWQGFDYSTEHLAQIAEKITGEPFDIDKGDLYHELCTPAPWIKRGEVKPINEIAWTTSLFRDEKILESVYKYLNSFDRIFIVYGSGHALKLEFALKYLLENHNI